LKFLSKIIVFFCQVQKLNTGFKKQAYNEVCLFQESLSRSKRNEVQHVIFASKHQCSNITTLTLLVGQQAENLTRENLSYEGAKQKLKVETVLTQYRMEQKNQLHAFRD